MDSRSVTTKITLICTMLMLLATESASSSSLMPDCSSSSCGNLTIPLPFSSSAHCINDDSFLITCNESYDPPKAFLNSGNVEVIDISIDGFIRVRSSISSDCYGSRSLSEHTSYKFPISTSRNRFTAIGCDTYAILKGSGYYSNQTNAGCVSLCDSVDGAVEGTCSGIGCCQASILHGVKDFSVDIRRFRNLSTAGNFSPCGYAFVVEAGAFEFSSLDLKGLRNITDLPVVLDWSIGNVTCEAARNLSTYACRTLRSECLDAGHGLGYRCSCMKGFEGNPYLVDDCKDIDECATTKPCIGACKNMVGNYSCSCPEGFEGDGVKNGSGCYSKSRHQKKVVEVSTMFYITSGLVIPGVGSFWILRRRKLNKLAKLRRSTFERNGGLMLDRRLRVFTAEELQTATDNHADIRILDRSCIPDETPIFMGELEYAGEKRLVTIKSYCIQEKETEAFVKKLNSFCNVYHKHVSNLIGCCLETPVPLLVHEFVFGHTLSDYITNDDLASSLSWDIRLRIAAETARALTYLHSETRIPIVHGNLSSHTISLQNRLTVKIYDFVFTNNWHTNNSDVTYFSGTMGYIDPECLYLGQWTEKSDVYSFGAILAELLTGKNPTNFFLENNCSIFSFLGDDALLAILDKRVETMDGVMEQLIEASKLAEKCLSGSSVDRPTMQQVEVALACIIGRSSSNSAMNNSKTSTRMTIARRFLRQN